MNRTYDEIQKRATKIWTFQLAKLALNYNYRNTRIHNIKMGISPKILIKPKSNRDTVSASIFEKFWKSKSSLVSIPLKEDIENTVNNKIEYLNDNTLEETRMGIRKDSSIIWFVVIERKSEKTSKFQPIQFCARSSPSTTGKEDWK
ncbi:hypothetical protein HK096_009630, partial [Nowakowskiella sp. JEL0078]